MKLVEDRYNDAWKHHYTNNKHHPEFWINEDGTIRDMDLDAIIEMLCDWNAVSLMFGTSVLDWYEKQAVDDEQKAMTPKTIEITEEFLYNILYH